jgi:hypothetical protein
MYTARLVEAARPNPIAVRGGPYERVGRGGALVVLREKDRGAPNAGPDTSKRTAPRPREPDRACFKAANPPSPVLQGRNVWTGMKNTGRNARSRSSPRCKRPVTERQ